VASLSQGRTAAAQCGLFTYKSVPVIFEPPCIYTYFGNRYQYLNGSHWKMTDLIYNISALHMESCMLLAQV